MSNNSHHNNSKIPLRIGAISKIPFSSMERKEFDKKIQSSKIDSSIRNIERLILNNKHLEAISILLVISPFLNSKEGPPSIDPRWLLPFWSLRVQLQSHSPSSFPLDILSAWERESLKFLSKEQQFEIFNERMANSFKRQISLDSLFLQTMTPPKLTLSNSECDNIDYPPPVITLSTPPLRIHSSPSPPILADFEKEEKGKKGSTYLYEIMSPIKKDSFVSPVRRSVRKMDEEDKSMIPRKKILFERLDQIPNLTTFIPNLSVQAEMMDSPKKKRN